MHSCCLRRELLLVPQTRLLTPQAHSTARLYLKAAWEPAPGAFCLHPRRFFPSIFTSGGLTPWLCWEPPAAAQLWCWAFLAAC